MTTRIELDIFAAYCRSFIAFAKLPDCGFETLIKALANIGFESLCSDLYIFKYRFETILLIVYIDDILIFILTKIVIALIIKAIENYFKLKKLNNIKYFLN